MYNTVFTPKRCSPHLNKRGGAKNMTTPKNLIQDHISDITTKHNNNTTHNNNNNNNNNTSKFQPISILG